MSGSAITEEEIFLAARELGEPGERVAYLDRVCGDHSELRRRVERLLEASVSADGLFERIDVAEALVRAGGAVMESMAPQPGSRVGRYRLIEKIGEGGFGVVFMAEQREPIRRKVALKIIKPGMDTEQVLARFEAERQALAMMDHPNIAKVLDAGATETGHPYFVMELVRGVPITKFREENKLGLKERLELFLPACRAIQHAHQKGVIHRDIKPGNILVSIDYGEPVVKVIDFGVAKAIGQRLTDRSFHTMFNQMIGTPAYMSPEQAEMSNLDVDTRTDVYSLGVLLYELLTGTPPFAEKELLSRGLDDMRRVIREEEPERPSARASRQQGRSTLGWRSQPGQLSDSLRGDLDWIILRAIEKDRRRRYDTPNELAADVQRHLDSEPVVARPPTSLYRLRKFVNRHKTGAAAGLAVTLALVVGLGAALIGFFRAHEESRRASREEAVATAVTEFLAEKLLGAADINQGGAYGSPERDLRVMTVVDRAAAQLPDSFEGQPLVEATVRLTLGKVYRGLGETEEAERHLRAAVGLFEQEVGAEEPRTLEAKHTLTVLLHLNRFALHEAEALARQVVAGRKRVLGPDDEQTLESELELARIHLDLQKLAEAEALLKDVERRAREIEPGSAPMPIELSARQSLARLAWQRGDRDQATDLYREIFQQRKATQGMTNTATLASLSDLVFAIHQHERDQHEAEALTKEGLEIASRILADWGPAFDLRRQLAVMHGRKGLFLESEALRLENLELALEKAGPRHPISSGAKSYVAFVHAHYGRDETAARLLEEVLLTVEDMKLTSWSTLMSRGWLASLYWRHGRRAEAIGLRERGVAKTLSVYGREARFTVNEVEALAGLHSQSGSWQEARKVLGALDGGNRVPAPTLARSALVSRLAGASELAEGLCRSALAQADRTHPASNQSQVNLTALVLLPDAPVSTARESTDDLGRLERRLLRGMEDVRAAEYQRALSQLTPIVESHPEAVKRVLAGYFCAIAAYHHGDHTASVKWAETARNDLMRLSAGGDLGSRWAEIAQGLVAQDGAERLLQRRTPAPTVDQAFLEAAHKRWRPVHVHIKQAAKSARSQDWSAARDSYLAAIRAEPFTWEAADLLYPRLAQKMGLTFALAGDGVAYTNLCGRFAGFDAEVDDQFAEIRLLSGATNVFGEASLLLHKRRTAQEPESEGVPHAPEWEQIILGLELLNEGDLVQAARAFSQAQSAYSLACAGVAFAYGGRLQAQQGHEEGARRCRAQARENLDRLRQSHGEDWGKYWFEMAWLQLLLESDDWRR